jgi:YD repeat-containing protein
MHDIHLAASAEAVSARARAFSARSSTRRLGLLILGATLSVIAAAATTTYEYDALGRLRVVTHANGNVTTYTLDPAGNRTQVDETSGQAPPSSLSVPATSLTGSYTVTWSGGGAFTSYELFESTTANFSSQIRVYLGAGTSASISGHGNGTFYYRLKGCNGSACTGYVTGANGVAVTVPPGVPSYISVPTTSNTGTFSVGWGTAVGTMTKFELYESSSSSFSGESLVYSGTGASTSRTRGNGVWYYRVRACNGNACSGYAAGPYTITVTIPPGTPPSINVPTGSQNGSYTVSWGASSGTVTGYQLYEATNSGFTGASLIHNAAGTSVALSGRGDGTYYYRVRACNGSECSGYASGSNPTSVTLPPGAPASFTVPSGSPTGSFSISWGAASGTVTAYRLFEATNSGFSGETEIYTGTGNSTSVSGRANGTYYYRVRACNVSVCGSYASGANPTVVTLPPSAPASITVPTGSQNGSYTVSWAASTGNITAYELYEATNSGFTGETRIHNATTTSIALSGRGNGTYYYRVRACNVTACSGYAFGANSTSVTLPPGAPASITVPAGSNTGNYSISWGTASGTVTAYQLYEATNSSFSGESLVYSGTGSSASRSGRGNGTYYYRVRACNSSACGNYAPGAYTTVVTLPPSAPSSITVPAGSQTGSYTVSWGASTGNVTAYQLYEANNSGFTGETLVHNASATSIALNGRGNGNYYYRVRACNGTACSGLVPGSNSTSVTLPPGAPASITVPAGSTTGSYSISWGTASGTVTAYQLYEATNSNFSGESLVYSGTGSSASRSGRGNGTYYYRVRACNGSACGNFAPGSNSTLVTLPPGAPASISVPGTNNSGSYTVSWGSASGQVTAYEVYEATNSGFSGASLIYNSTGSSVALSRGNGTYYYRARACNAGSCGGYSSTVSIVVTLPPGAPSYLTVPSGSTTGNYLVQWGASSGMVSAYEVYEATNSGFSGETLAYSGGTTSFAPIGKTNGTYYYRVRACYNGQCSGFTTTNSVTVNLGPPARPLPESALSYNQNSMCSWTANWPASDRATYYQVRARAGSIQVNSATNTVVYDFCGASNYSGIPWDYRPSWVKACNADGCSPQTNFP